MTFDPIAEGRRMYAALLAAAEGDRAEALRVFGEITEAQLRGGTCARGRPLVETDHHVELTPTAYARSVDRIEWRRLDPDLRGMVRREWSADSIATPCITVDWDRVEHYRSWGPRSRWLLPGEVFGDCTAGGLAGFDLQPRPSLSLQPLRSGALEVFDG